jgi:hypothetical protein
MTSGAYLSARRKEGQRCRRSTRACWAGLGRRQPGKEWADWAEIRRENLFGIKIEFFNLPTLWKFIQGDLGGILMWGVGGGFQNSSRILKDF